MLEMQNDVVPEVVERCNPLDSSVVWFVADSAFALVVRGNCHLCLG